ncbi:CARDB domain-containing protein [Knoellia sp. S7-12]|uniref:CARDB domain-containing protein n=1 Tax=Knoellia sp. S7-12 TaxID=3126698 RepID=UPI003366CF42
MSRSQNQTGRTSAEWTTFVGSCLILAVVVALVLSQLVGTHAPAAPRASIGSVTTVGEQHHVDVEVSNAGDETAANVQVSMEFVVDGKASEADQVIDFLAGGEKAQLVFILDDPVTEGELTVDITGFTVP